MRLITVEYVQRLSFELIVNTVAALNEPNVTVDDRMSYVAVNTSCQHASVTSPCNYTRMLNSTAS